ncbi:MAG: dUTP diphosphatase [Sediminibacterium sp.]|jgi:dUTP pyrophosphatase|nr:dUTP diphosphatase [Chitinophagaceae bacterium]MCA6447736.1 dUTP diphosphatase [Chitinophagaceae bacterium]
MKVKIVNKSSHPSPHYATPGSSGLDIRADIIEPIQFAPMERRLIPTGIFIALPIGYEAQVRPRSGLALKQGITCLNSPGTVDADYRGELKVLLINLSAEMQVINNGDRIAQLVIQQVERIEWEEVETLEETIRGVGGFGSTGNH